LQGVRAIGQLARLAKWDEGFFHRQRHRRRQQEASRFGRRQRVDLPANILLTQALHRFTEGAWLAQERSYILEKDARLGKVGYVADVVPKIHGIAPLDGTIYQLCESEATMPLTIRRAQLTDATIIVEFNRRLALETEAKSLDRSLLAAGVAALLSDATKGFYFVAEEHGEVVGQLMITKEWSDWRNGWLWWIQSVYIREDFRRRGVFRALYRYVEKTALEETGVVGLRLYVEHENTRAQETYRSLGMQPTSYLLFERCPL
jgi:ribosomal protein S18 acetylase RimI-like enzyme